MPKIPRVLNRSASGKIRTVFRDFEKKPVVSEPEDPPTPVPSEEGIVHGVVIGDDSTRNRSGGRPPPLLQPQVDALSKRVASLEAAIAVLQAEVAALKTHHHSYQAGVNYTNRSIHGHPAWDVDTKLVSLITSSMSFSANWTTSPPKN